MSPSLVLVYLALTVTPYLACAQTTPNNTSSATTPLASKTFNWKNLVSTFVGVRYTDLISVNSPIKLTLTIAPVAVSAVTIAAIQPLRTRDRSARPLFSIRLTVRNPYLIPVFSSGLTWHVRFLYLGST